MVSDGFFAGFQIQILRSCPTVIDVSFCGSEVRPAELTVVIDALRASSTIAQALAAGYERVLCVASANEARALAAPGRVLAGERDCLRLGGFQFGNSPADAAVPQGSELVMTTTNGTPAIVRAAELSDEVLVGALVNLDALVEAIGDRDVLLLCAGSDGRPALEDAYVAGRIAAALDGELSDAALIARSLARAHVSAGGAFAAGAHGRKLARLGLGADVDWCARESLLAVVPRVAAVDEQVAVVEPSDPPPYALATAMNNARGSR
jgi:2-phosphosulfolactate phosphatase